MGMTEEQEERATVDQEHVDANEETSDVRGYQGAMIGWTCFYKILVHALSARSVAYCRFELD